jgi:hypothetical protein
MSSSSRRPAKTIERSARARRLAGFVVCGASFSLSGCSHGGELQHTIGRYELGHYQTTASSCAELGDDAAGMNDKAQVRYLVYCGLAHYKLGHVYEASEMLTKGSQRYAEGSLGWLKPDVVDELLKALDDIEGTPRRLDSPTIARAATTSR